MSQGLRLGMRYYFRARFYRRTSMIQRPELAALYRQHAAGLKAFLKAKIGCPESAAELAQETFLRLLEQKQAPHNPVGFTYQIARNLAIDAGRQKSHVFASEANCLDDCISNDPCLESSAYQRQRLRLVEEAVAELPPQCRRVFLLHRFGGLSQIEVAGQLGISRQMVEKHVAKALLHLRARLAEHGAI
ncbi:MAG: RNA polymerase sigma factor [Candidatus Ferrigenium altingense]